jgi:hypothetical protein
MAYFPIPVAARCKAWVFRPYAYWDCGLKTARGMDVCLLCELRCRVEVCASVWLLVQKSPTDYGVSKCV